MGSLTGFLAGGGAVLAAGAVVVLLHRYGDAILRWFAGVRYTVQPREPHGYVPLMGGPDPAAARRPLDAPEALPEPPPLPKGNPPPDGQGRPYVHLELTQATDGVQAGVSVSGRQVATFAVDTIGGVGVIGTAALMAELQRQGSLTELMEQLHWSLPMEDLLAEVAKRAHRP
jgi:hypothetical protein